MLVPQGKPGRFPSYFLPSPSHVGINHRADSRPSHPSFTFRPSSVEFITQTSIFSSFAPSYDSTASTMSVYQSARLLQSQRVLEYKRDSLVESLSSSNKSRRVEESEATELEVEDILEKNWTWVRRLEELQRLRVLEGEKKPSEEENELGESSAPFLRVDSFQQPVELTFLPSPLYLRYHSLLPPILPRQTRRPSSIHPQQYSLLLVQQIRSPPRSFHPPLPPRLRRPI